MNLPARASRSRCRSWVALAVLAAVGWPQAARAAEGSRSATALERRVADLEERASRLEEVESEIGRLEDEVEALKSQLGAEGRDAEEAAQLEERIRALRDQLSTHDDRLRGIRRDLDHALGALPDIRLSGEIDLAYGYDFNRPDDGRVSLRAVESDDDNDFSFHHAKLAASGSILDTVDARLELVFGRTATFLGSRTVGAIGTDDLDVAQAYLSYKAAVGSGLTVTLGKVASRIGAEVAEAPANDQFSRSFLFTLGIPHTQTGLLASYSFLDGGADLEMGVVNGWDAVDDDNAAKTLVARAADHLGDGVDLALAGIWGAEQDDRNGPKRAVVDGIITIRPFDDLSFLLDFLYGAEAEVPALDPAAAVRDVRWLGFSGIARWDATDAMSLSLRGEVFDDRDGARSGTGQRLWEVTETVAYEVVENLVVRVEHRHDESDHATYGDQDGLSRSQDTASCDAYYRF